MRGRGFVKKRAVVLKKEEEAVSVIEMVGLLLMLKLTILRYQRW